MTNKNHRWQANWERLPDGSLRHVSGLVMRPERGDGFTDFLAAPATLSALNAWLVDVRRTAPHDMQRAAVRLMNEAAEWHRQSP